MDQPETIAHTLSGYSTKYIEGKLEVKKDKSSLYTQQWKTDTPIAQSVMIYKGTPKENPHDEKILKRAIPEKDGRKRISDTTK